MVKRFHTNEFHHYLVYRIRCRAMIALGSVTKTPFSSDTDVTRCIRESQDFSVVIATSQAIMTRYGEDVQDVAYLSAWAGFSCEYMPLPCLPLLWVLPNANNVNEDFIILQMPQDGILQNWLFKWPRSQMHCELWNVRSISGIETADVNFCLQISYLPRVALELIILNTFSTLKLVLGFHRLFAKFWKAIPCGSSSSRRGWRSKSQAAQRFPFTGGTSLHLAQPSTWWERTAARACNIEQNPLNAVSPSVGHWLKRHFTALVAFFAHVLPQYSCWIPFSVNFGLLRQTYGNVVSSLCQMWHQYLQSHTLLTTHLSFW